MIEILLSIHLFLLQAGPAVSGTSVSPKLLATIGKKGTGPAEFYSPEALALDERWTLYVSDAGTNRIQVFDSMGAYLREISGEAVFKGIAGLALSGTTGLLVADLPGRELLRVDRYGSPLGDFYKPEGTLFLPQGLVVSRSGDVVVCEGGSHRILVLSAVGDLLRSFGGFGTGSGNLSDPIGVIVREADKAIWVVERGNSRIQSFSYWGEPQGILGKGKLKNPESVTLDGKGRIWIADTGHDRVVAFSEAGEEIGEIKDLARPGFVLCSGTRLYISDTGNHRVLVYGLEGP